MSAHRQWPRRFAPGGRLLFVAQPLVVALALALRILHDGVAVLDADGIVEPPHGAAAAPKFLNFRVWLSAVEFQIT